jgi:hypothetical protein
MLLDLRVKSQKSTDFKPVCLFKIILHFKLLVSCKLDGRW